MKNFKAMGAAKSSRQQGFTIIELVVVILLLGILTATALPRFLNISEEAHDAVMDGVQGALQTGLALYKANWFALGQTTSAIADWGSLVPNTLGYPVGTSGGTAGGTTDLHSECESIYRQLMDMDAGAPTVNDAFALAPTAAAADATAGAVSNAMITEAALATQPVDIMAVLTASNACSFVYIADAQRQTAALAPTLTYNSATGVLTRSN